MSNKELKLELINFVISELNLIIAELSILKAMKPDLEEVFRAGQSMEELQQSLIEAKNADDSVSKKINFLEGVVDTYGKIILKLEENNFVE
jgi:hypothetical protein